ncbi:MAG: N-acetylmuramoyl-L-alanine amidase, partial [Candidatus Angelobacter sp.]
DQGRVLNDSKSYTDAIGQLAFLRREYPGSRHRVEALFTIAQIYRDDLKDNDQAKATFEDFLKHYPHNALAPKAKNELVEIGDLEAGGNPFKRKSRARHHSEPEAKAAWAEEEDRAVKAAKENKSAEQTPARSVKPSAGHDGAARQSAREDAAQPQPDSRQDVSLEKTDTQPLGRMPRLTGIRHWSTPDYVRVAIDLEQEVQYQAGRVPHPDRIFFDLYGVKLASDLVGKSFDVEAGFLHRIRVAQYKPNMARVVLDVDDVAEYSAFLLPNPYRLIIDIHGKLPNKQEAEVAGKQDIPAADNARKPDTATRQSPPEQNDVTVTHVAPPRGTKSKGDAADALQRAEDARAGQTRGKLPATTEVAKAQPERIVVDDAAPDTTDTPDTDTANSRPTSGPTYQAVAPRQSSRKKQKKLIAEAPASTTHVAAPTADGERSLIRALGLKIGKIVVDAGHGGHDTGTIGPNGLMEKDLVLDVALKLGKLLENRLGAEVVYTRDDDTFVPLETRTAIANKEQADLFISVHANSSSDASARGVETYYLNFTSSRDALETA